MGHEESEENTDKLWIKYYKGFSEKRNGQMILIILIVAFLLLLSDVFFNDYPSYLNIARLVITCFGFLAFLLFKVKKISGELMVMLYAVPTVIIGAYMIAIKTDLPGVVQATSITTIFGFVIVTLLVLKPVTWIIISSAAAVSYILLIIFTGEYQIQVYLANGGTLFLLCYAGFPYVDRIRYRLYQKNFLLQNEIEFYANNDLLTGTCNRRCGMKILEQLTDMYSRNELRLAICFIDVNGLKNVNDQFGHNAGDELIVAIADIIKNRIRKSDTLFRYGGDEFVVIFPDCGGAEAAEIMQTIRTEAENRKNDYSLSFSYGIAEYKGEFSPEDLIQLADERMYLDKQTNTQF